ncbi:MAG: hypothetical protein U0Q10_05945 [Dermatophilaceae bacterium]
MRPRIGDHQWRSEDLVATAATHLDVRPHTDRTTVLDDNLGDLVVDPAGAAVGLDLLAGGFGECFGAADREPRPVPVVVDDQGVAAEGAVCGRQSVVTPLRGEQRAQLGVAEVGVQIVAGGHQGQSPSAQATGGQARADPCARRPTPCLEAVPIGGSTDIPEVGRDGVAFGGEALAQALPILRRVVGHGEVEAGVVEVVEVGGHR